MVRATNPLAWWFTRVAAKRFFSFAKAERASMVDLIEAARLTASPERSALYLAHAADEARHARVFATLADDLARDRGAPPFGPLVVDVEHLFETLGEERFLAFVNIGESRGVAQFREYVRYLRGVKEDRLAGAFESVLADEERHMTYTRELLLKVAGNPTAAAISKRRMRARMLFAAYRRAGRGIASLVYRVTMLPVYLLVGVLRLFPRNARDHKPAHAFSAPKTQIGPDPS